MIGYTALRLALLIVMVVTIRRIWRASALHALLSIFIPGYIFVPTVKYWNDPDHNIHWHVLFLLVGGLTACWWGLRIIHEYQAGPMGINASQQQVPTDQLSDDPVNDAADDTAAPMPDESQDAAATLDAVRHTHPMLAPSKRVPAVEVAPAPAAAQPAAAQPRLPPNTWQPPDSRPEVVITFARAATEAKFTRGKFDLASMGITLGLPGHFHAFGGVDARRIRTSLGLPNDNREIAWVLHEDVPLSGASSWHVRVRWLDDGWVDATIAHDAEQLLRSAQRGAAAAPRLAGSGGKLLGYAVAPSFAADMADWVEERLPDGVSSSVLDCHALKLGRKGVLELSIVGAPAGSQALCHASVRLLARRASVDNGAERPRRAPTDVGVAPYTLEGLVTQRQ